MNDKRGSWCAKARFPIIFFIGFCLNAITHSAVVTAQSVTPQSPGHTIENAMEGAQFVGPFGAEGETDPQEDTFTFKDGKFSTASCLKWGFTPAPYWLRRGPNGLQFLAELKSPEHGTIRYEGVFDGKALTVVGYWKKERWYWTIERTYRGKGHPKVSTR